VAVGAGQAERDRAAGQRDPREERAVEEREEGEERAAGAARADAGLGDRPQGQRGAADARRGDEAGRGGAAEGDLRAGSEVEPGSGAVADEPEQRDVAAEGEELGDGCQRDPARVRRQRAGERVGHDVQGAAGEEQDGGGRSGEGEGERRAPCDQPHVQRGEREIRGSHDIGGGSHTTSIRMHCPPVHRGCP